MPFVLGFEFFDALSLESIVLALSFFYALQSFSTFLLAVLPDLV
jgi:hypothetical protein